ncbi:MAG: glycosyltransferase, partial [Aphanizomenon sp.]
MPLLTNLSFLLTKPTGTTTYALNLLPHLQKLDPILLTSQSLPDYNCYQTPHNLTSEQGLKGHLNRLFWTQFQLPKIYQNLKSQLLFSPTPEAPLYTNCRFIVTAFDMIPLRFPKRLSPLTTYHKYYTPEVFKQAEHIICISESTANDITQFYQIPSNKITSIALAGDNSHFQFLNLPTRNYFLYIGRQDPYKNLPRLISAFSALPNRNDYELWLAGPYDKR